jgi:hypothetical protein
MQPESPTFAAYPDLFLTRTRLSFCMIGQKNDSALCGAGSTSDLHSAMKYSD